MDLYAVARCVLRNRRLIAFVLTASALLTLALALLLPRRYTSSFVVLSPDGGTAALLQTLRHDSYNSGVKGWMIPHVLRDPRFLEGIACEPLCGRESLAERAGARDRETIRRLMQRVVSVSVDEMNGSIRVAATTQSPDLSYEVALHLLQHLNTATDAIRDRLRADYRAFYGARIGEAVAALRASETEVSAFLSANRGWMETTDPGSTRELSRVEREQRVRADVYAELHRQSEMDDLRAWSQVPVLEILDAPRVPTLKSFPRRRIIAMLGMLAGVLLAGTASIGADIRRRIMPQTCGR